MKDTTRNMLSLEQTEIALQWLKQSRYYLFGFGGDFWDQGFEIKYINEKSNVIRLQTVDKIIQEYLLKNGTWRLTDL